MSKTQLNLQAVLFDLDGTLIDSAPDLGGAGNEMRLARGLEPYPLERFRPMVGSGARGMLSVALGVDPQDDHFIDLRDEFLQRYEARMTHNTHVFKAMLPVLQALKDAVLPWGIVTNKAARFSEPLLRALPDLAATATLVCGDTMPRAKPHPDPLLEAARRMNVAPEHCVYVGDDLRDIQAGQAAGMPTVAVAWGYLGMGEAIDTWGATHIAKTPHELLKLFNIT
jgi:N-acetyl-D-muramate 6-phosphate phosphatase